MTSSMTPKPASVSVEERAKAFLAQNGDASAAKVSDPYLTELASRIDEACWIIASLQSRNEQLERERERMHFCLGDEVAVIPDCRDWAADWRDTRLWIAAIQAVEGGGIEYWVSDTWPLPDRAALTDGFYMNTKDEPDTLVLVARAALTSENKDAR
jgi:hypothetical protein